MSEDIHQKQYVKERKTQKYIDALQLVEPNDRVGCLFGDIFNGRNYDFFSLFGSTRGNYKQLEHLTIGCPEFLARTSFDAVLKDYH